MIFGIIAAVVLVGAALGRLLRKRRAADASFDGSTQSRIDDHRVQRGGDQNFDRFGGGGI